MPCNSITVQSVGGLEKAMPDLVKAAFLAWSGYEARVRGAVLSMWAPDGSAVVSWESGKGLSISSGSEGQAQAARGAVLQAYSRAAVSWAASRSGFKVSAWADNKAVIQMG